ncbi:MAG: penicillin acylase family protein [Phycisphaerae bacterium]|nr:penicillin acylase family protein [Phycisphaerae bacterium]
MNQVVSRVVVLLTVLLVGTAPKSLAAGVDKDAEAMARGVTIYRDGYGVPHIDGPTDASVIFGFAYCQAEDFLWQIEDSYIQGLGRYSELHGSKELETDLLARTFEIPRRAREEIETIDPESRTMCRAFAAGLNYFLDKHPDVTLRLLERFEPWHVLAGYRAIVLKMVYKGPRKLSTEGSARAYGPAQDAIGSNAWAIAPSKTRSGNTMLFANPHQPYYGFGQFYEAHLRSGEGWSFSGGTFFGSLLPTIGFNEYLGWSFTVNNPDSGDTWIEIFDDRDRPLNYRYGDGYRTATEWKDVIAVKTGKGMTIKEYTLRKTHHGPVVRHIGGDKYLSANVGKLHEAFLARQTLKMVRSRNLAEIKRAMEGMEQHLFNMIYADRDGNIYYLYNGIVPRRDPRFDWSHSVDGTDPNTDWKGVHRLDEMPQVLNPISGFVQSCNQSPFTATDDGNAYLGDFPGYMVAPEEQLSDKRRAKVSRYLLRGLKDVTYEQWLELIFDTTIYWALTELPKFERKLERLKQTDAALASRVEPYMKHLLDWDCRGGVDSTQATLCLAWCEEMYGSGYGMSEKLKQEFIGNPARQLEALVAAAEKLRGNFGTWKIAYGKINRLQRHANVADFYKIPFNDKLASLPSAGLPGPVGAVFTQYFTPSIPFVKPMMKHYGVVGNSYMAAVEFGKRVRARTLVQFGASGDPKSPHFFDQAGLLSQKKLKEMPFYWEDVKAAAKRVYHPGDPD